LTVSALRDGWTEVSVGGSRYARRAVRTRWLNPDDALAVVLREYVGEARPGDTVVVSEKVAILLTGRALPIEAVRPGRLARVLARSVRPRPGSQGLAVPEKMQYVVQTVGRGRTLVAAASGAVTRAVGIQGVFYRVAGPIARDVDGGRPPYQQMLFPPLQEHDARRICSALEAALGVGVAIVDLNDFGGTIRAVSPAASAPGVLLAVLADNPLGQRLTSTPFGIVRPIA
jgi:F420-0:gamma-glutamyl ligase